MCMHQVRRKVMIQKTVHIGIKGGFQSFSYIPYENYVMRF